MGARKIFFAILCFCWFPAFFNPHPAAAGQGAHFPKQIGQLDMEMQFSGHVKVRGGVSRPGTDSFFAPVGGGGNRDGHIEARLKSLLLIGKSATLEAHYELLWSAGETRHKYFLLQNTAGGAPATLFADTPRDDDRRLFDLNHRIHEKNDQVLNHRIDRLVLTLQPGWGAVSIGRQALTWGNGLLFNPMDLFNPFAPTEIERDYKVGDDMVVVGFITENGDDVEVLAVPRRDLRTGRVEWDQSSLAAKLHFNSGETEYDLLAAKHYRDGVIGVGRVGFWGDAAWRLDTTWTFMNPEQGRNNDYLSIVANIDYSWVWRGRNFYGLVEFFYNGLGSRNYTEQISDPDVAERLDRGNLFTLGKKYLAGEVRVEIHPLLNVSLSSINNFADPSGIFLPRAYWDVSRATVLTCGATIPYGKKGSEYGGFLLPGSVYRSASALNFFLWATWHY